MVGVPGTGVLGPAVFRALRALEGLLEVIPGPRGTGVDVVDHVWMFFMYAICGPFIIIRSIQLKTPPLPYKGRESVNFTHLYSEVTGARATHRSFAPPLSSSPHSKSGSMSVGAENPSYCGLCQMW